MEDGHSFGPFVFDAVSGELTRDGKPVAVGQRGLALLKVLLEANGQPVDKEMLLQRGWPGTIVEEVNLSVQIAALRKTLGSAPGGEAWIATVPRVGYRLPRRAAPVATVAFRRLPTVAVLPFHNLSGDASQEYFADGIVDDLITALSRFRSFVVIARGSSFARKGRATDVRDVASELGASYVLEGSVRRRGNRLRLVAHLADGADGANLWAETFDGILGEVFEFQDRITRSVAGVIEPHVQQAELDRSRRERPSSVAAYDLYLRALAKIYTFTPDGNAEAFQLLETALVIEPDNGVFMAFACWALEIRHVLSRKALGRDDRKRGLDLAHRAVQLAGNDATVLAHGGLAMQTLGQEYERGLRVVKRALELNPCDVAVIFVVGVAHLANGDFEQALMFLHRAIDIQPNDAYEAMGVAAYVYCCLGRFEEALLWSQRCLARKEEYEPAHWVAVAANAQLGRIEAAHVALEGLLRLAPGLTLKKLSRVAKKNVEQDFLIVNGLRLVGVPEA